MATTKHVDDLSAPELLVLSKFFAKKAVNKNKKWKISDDLDEGDYSGVVDLNMSLSYSFNKGGDYPAAPTTSMPYLASMVIALHRAGFQRKKIAETILEAASEALNSGDKVGDELSKTIEYVDKEVKALKDKFRETLPQITIKGRVTKVKMIAE